MTGARQEAPFSTSQGNKTMSKGNAKHTDRLALVTALAVGLQLPATVAGHAANWSTNYGTMSLPEAPRSGPVRAPYSEDNGRIVGTMWIPKCPGCGPLIEGVWIENSSGETCSTKQEGSAHWGKVTLTFAGPYSSFTGTWDYCGSGATRSWTGKLGTFRMMLKSR